uniref:Uncharacterized protein n=1 Tax=Anguilla anguilla TaxID=7936 RepID=A0A0E9XQZ6_ANGAN
MLPLRTLVTFISLMVHDRLSTTTAQKESSVFF